MSVIVVKKIPQDLKLYLKYFRPSFSSSALAEFQKIKEEAKDSSVVGIEVMVPGFPQLFEIISDVSQDDFIGLAVVGYLYGRRYSEQLKDKATKKEAEKFAEWATEFHLTCGLFANILRGHLAITFNKKGEAEFHCTAVGKRWVEENLLRPEKG